MSSPPSRDVAFMQEAIELSKGGYPAPNPHVGCVIVKGDVIIGRGHHAYAGGPHAEAAALAEAGSEATGADVYVTLEPCNHFGRTPPCSKALIEAGVRRVVYACSDPNPQAEGGSVALLQAGVEVEEGLLEEEAALVNRQFLFAMRHRRPMVTIKAAMSLDGRIALPTGESKWITSRESREEAHRLRALCGAVLVGRGTVEADDPLLTSRIAGVVNQPVRVVLDPHRRLSGNEKVFNDDAETIHFSQPQPLREILEELFSRGINGVLVEGGALTIASFISEGLADRFELFVAPKVLGWGPSWVEGLQLESLVKAPQLSLEHVRMVGPDVQISATLAT